MTKATAFRRLYLPHKMKETITSDLLNNISTACRLQGGTLFVIHSFRTTDGKQLDIWSLQAIATGPSMNFQLPVMDPRVDTFLKLFLTNCIYSDISHIPLVQSPVHGFDF